MFGNLRLRRRIDALEAQLAASLAENQRIQQLAEEAIKTAVSESKAELTSHFERELDPQVRAWAYAAVHEEAVSARDCGHAEQVVMAVTTFTRSMPSCELGELFSVDGQGTITKQRTCYSTVGAGDKSFFKVYAKKCLRCGKVSPVDWFDVAAAGSSIVDRSVSDFESLKKQPNLVDQVGRSGVSSLDEVLQS